MTSSTVAETTALATDLATALIATVAHPHTAPSHVNLLARLMTKGRFDEDTVIRLGASGQLLGGIDRCAAVLQSGCTITVLIVRESERDTWASYR
jgi:hypothetical protein